MNKIIIFIITFTPFFSIYSDSLYPREHISIYHDMDEDFLKRFGRSLHRNIVTTVSDLQFNHSSSYNINSDINYFITAVTIDKMTIDYLNSILMNALPLMLDEYEISIDPAFKDNITEQLVYRFVSRRTGLDLSFSVIEAPSLMIEMIELYYQDDPSTLELVKNYYKENYVISIFASENIFDQRNNNITLADAMIMATLIGDIDQPMWGIHDGNGLLKRVLALTNRK